MSQDAALDDQNAQGGYAALFDRVAELAKTVQPDAFVEPVRFARLMTQMREWFPGDCARVNDVAALLTGADDAAYGVRAADVFTRWTQEGGGPSAPALLAEAMSVFGIEIDDDYALPLFMAGALAEIPNRLQYHGNEHYRKVLFHVIRLIATHNSLGVDPFNKREIATLLVAACIHDLGHTGGDNLKDGVYTPGYLEQRATDIARPYLVAAGLGADDMGAVDSMVFTTDITFFAGDNCPCIRMKKIFHHVFLGDQGDDIDLMMMGKLRRYENNPQLLRMAMILHEADIATSAALSYEQTMIETINIIEERGLRTASPRVVLGFLRDQLGARMYTDAAKRLFDAPMKIIIDQAERDALAGRESYYT